MLGYACDARSPCFFDFDLCVRMFAAARAAELQRCEEWFQQAQKARLRPSSAMYTALVTAAAAAW